MVSEENLPEDEVITENFCQETKKEGEIGRRCTHKYPALPLEQLQCWSLNVPPLTLKQILLTRGEVGGGYWGRRGRVKSRNMYKGPMDKDKRWKA